MLEDYFGKYLEHPLIRPNTVEFRLYQKRIAEIASEKNTLVILPTALGKTIISVIVAANILYNYKDAKVLVMAPTRPLVIQHSSSFIKLLKLRKRDVGILTGKISPDYRRIIWDGNARVIFATPQVVRNDILEHRLFLEEYGLLVFDECHRAVKEYAYTDIAQYYISQAGYPLILGMTASPGSDPNRVLDVCRNLYVEQIEYRTEEDPDVKPYIQPINIEWRKVNLPREYLEIKCCIRSMLDRRLNWLHEKGIIKNKPSYITRRNLIEAGDELRLILEESIEEERSRIFTAIINQSLALTLFHMLELLETQGLFTLKAFLEKVESEKGEKRSYIILVNDSEYRQLKTLIKETSVEHPKTELLKEIVKDQISRNFLSRMLIFTQYRDTASHLVEELNSIVGVKADRFVGQASKTLDKGLTQDEQVERIRRLKEGELNVLVATSIAEEGLDIPAVDHVIFYEPIPSEIRYIQRRGRTGRKSPGKVTILATEESLDMIYLFAAKRKTEKMKAIAENINLKLKPIIRMLQKPSPNPLTSLEIKTMEEEVSEVKAETNVMKTENDTMNDIGRSIEKLSRELYSKLLKHGRSGMKLDQIAGEKDLEGTPVSNIKSAIGKLMREGIVTEMEKDYYIITSSINLTGEKIYEIKVEKIYPDAAIVKVDNDLEAYLTSEEYNGPKGLIKKNVRFKAIADLYQVSKNLYIRVKEVTETIE